jgi:hypothetical protein
MIPRVVDRITTEPLTGAGTDPVITITWLEFCCRIVAAIPAIVTDVMSLPEPRSEPSTVTRMPPVVKPNAGVTLEIRDPGNVG